MSMPTMRVGLWFLAMLEKTKDIELGNNKKFSCQPNCNVTNVAANVKNFFFLKPVAFQVLETAILNLPWVPETTTSTKQTSLAFA